MPLVSNTYTSLVNDIQQYMENNSLSLTDEIPRLIYNSIQAISVDLKTIVNRVVLDFTLDEGVEVFPRPVNYKNMSTFDIIVGGVYQPLRKSTLDWCTAYTADSVAQGVPLFYTDFDANNFQISPIPDQAYSARIVFFQLPTSIYEGMETNSLTDNVYNLLLYRCLLEAIPFEKADERTKFDALYQATLAGYNNEEEMRKTSGFYNRSLQ